MTVFHSKEGYMARCYVVRKECGHIVAAFPVSMEPKAKAEILKQFARIGYDIEQTGEGEVGLAFAIACDCYKPPLLKLIDQQQPDQGVDQADVDAAGVDLEEDPSPEPEPPAPGVNHDAAADDLLNNFLDNKDQDTDQGAPDDRSS
jgi:hypothetical protein